MLHDWHLLTHQPLLTHLPLLTNQLLLLQAVQLQAMEAQLLALQLCAEGSRTRVAAAGAQYRVFLAWLMRVWQHLMAYDSHADSAGAHGALLRPRAVMTVLGFIEGQLRDDVIGAQVFGKVRLASFFNRFSQAFGIGF